ncbi:MAG: class I SAM-dependent methyltransferase [Anaerolineae bacterium]|nr:class I SAM-dependent methyltransferase [Anaerolineae bacterium]
MAEKVWITCNVCGADAFRELSSVGEWRIGQCAKCSLIYVNPVPLFGANSDEFSEVSLEFQYTRFMYEITPERVAYEKGQLQRQYDAIAGYTALPLQPMRFLDIGCGSGMPVRAASELGWEAVGVDINRVLIDLGKEKLGVDLRCVDLLDCGFEDDYFQFIRLRDVIEHLPNPYQMLAEVRRILAPGGVVLVVTPNEDGLPTQLRLLLHKKRVTVATVPPPHHLHGFTSKTLKAIADRARFVTHVVRTTTPMDALYVTLNNMQSAVKLRYAPVWLASRALGRGSVLVGWFGKPEQRGLAAGD